MASCHSASQVPTFLQTFTTPRASVSILTTYRFINKVLCYLQTKMPLQSYVLCGASVIGRDTTLHSGDWCCFIVASHESKRLIVKWFGVCQELLAPCDCRNPKNGIPSVFLRKGQRTLRAWEGGKSNLPRQGLPRTSWGKQWRPGSTFWEGHSGIFSFFPKHRKQENPVVWFGWKHFPSWLFPRSQDSVGGRTKTWNLTPLSRHLSLHHLRLRVSSWGAGVLSGKGRFCRPPENYMAFGSWAWYSHI